MFRLRCWCCIAQGWIDLGTRVVFVDMNIYNANVDMWLLMSVMAEFPATGGTVVSAKCVCQARTHTSMHMSVRDS